MTGLRVIIVTQVHAFAKNIATIFNDTSVCKIAEHPQTRILKILVQDSVYNCINRVIRLFYPRNREDKRKGPSTPKTTEHNRKEILKILPILKILVQDSARPQNNGTPPNQNPVNPFNPENSGSRQRVHQTTGSIFNDTFVCKIAVLLQNTPVFKPELP